MFRESLAVLKKFLFFAIGMTGLVAAQTSPALGPRIRIILVGDSTIAAGSGWGSGFCALVASNVTCVNMAKRGRSSYSYRAEGSWNEVMEQLNHSHEFKQTYVLIQFGHNDQPGKPGRSTVLETEFPQNLENYLRDVKKTGSRPVLITPLTRRWFTAGRVKDDLRPWAEATKRVAREQGVPLLDLHDASVRAVQEMGSVEANTLAMALPPAPVAEAAAGGNSVAVAKTPSPAAEPRSNTPRATPTMNRTVPPDPLPIFDYTHLGEKGAAFFGRMVAEELVTILPELRISIRE